MRDFKKTIKVAASDEEVYDALTKPFAIELWTGSHAVMDTTPGSEFELWDGDICGQNIEFQPNALIRQEWYFGDEEEQSIVTIKIKRLSASRTEIFVVHTNIPDEAYDNIVDGWLNSYLEPLRHFLEDGDEDE